MSDPKFGWHVYWIAPLLIIGSAVGRIRAPFKRYMERKRQRLERKRQEKIRASWTPEIRRARKLAGLE